jgi:hypothetical protein
MVILGVDFIIGTEKTDTGNIIDKLFAFADRNLVEKGRLVFLYPEDPKRYFN